MANAIRGKSVPAAQHTLVFLGKKASPAFGKLLNSAVANAASTGVIAEDLFVKTVTVNKGSMQKRGRPFGRGRSGVIRKTMSHIAIELAATPAKAATKGAVKKASAKKATS